ncbi:hypothetical protein ROA7450_00554 [Roseovarius albus]|uniref:Uncharacterized protein n=1 Tax=Roseovarius albus TaxID=1247867 RepID=A0A1X6YFC5_9RHOB|nr:hypothetical protein ROA7450_00554 [Roseovarius albus]
MWSGPLHWPGLVTGHIVLPFVLDKWDADRGASSAREGGFDRKTLVGQNGPIGAIALR